MRVLTLEGHTFAGDLIGHDDLVVDLGAHVGSFSRQIADRYGCRILGLEPDPKYFGQIPAIPNSTFLDKAIGVISGPVILNSGRKFCSSVRYRQSNTTEIAVEAICLKDLLDEFHVAAGALLKIDIEGFELEILCAENIESLKRFKQVTVEFHDFLHAEDRPRIRRAIQLMKAHGFMAIEFTCFNYADVLFLNKARLETPLLDWVRLTRFKYTRGITRMLKRMFANRGVTR
jgi:FkbM family methyltransferase